MTFVKLIEGQDAEWLREEMSETVVPSYTLAYSIFQKRILNPLLNASHDSLSTLLLTTINCAALDFRGNLSVAMNHSNDIRTMIDEVVMESIEGIAEWEAKIKKSTKELNALYIQMKSIQKQKTIAKQSVRDKEEQVKVANAAVREAEKAFENAMTCQGRRRRRKRLFGVMNVSRRDN